MILESPTNTVPPATTAISVPWSPNNSDGTYKNPVIFADYSDPDVVRVGDDFYMTASSFNCAPGLPILHSKDLVNWKIINHAIKAVPHPRFKEVQHGCGVWAPAIRFHAGKFWIFFPMPDEGIYVTTATDPAGEWSPPHLLQAGKGLIDPCPLWDEDGSAYLVHAWANSRAGIKSILTLRRMSPDGTKLLDNGVTVFDGHAHHPTIEGPKLYKRNGYYYIFAPAGGVATGWQTVLRSTNIFGPYEDKIVLAQGKTDINGPHQGAWVETKTGESWFIHFQDRDVYGRIVHLQPMRWVNDWPVMGQDSDGDGKGEPVSTSRKPDVVKGSPVAVPQTSDEFDSAKLGLQWQWQANFQESWFSLTAHPGWLRLHAVAMPRDAKNFWPVPNLLLQKLPAPAFTVTTKLDFSGLAVGDKAGLIMVGMDYSYLVVERTNTGFRLLKIACKDAHNGNVETQEQVVNLATDSIILRLSVANGAVVNFSYSVDASQFIPVGKPFTAREGKWIGAKVGLFCVAPADGKSPGYSDFKYFRFE